jgi:hypothetical protein
MASLPPLTIRSTAHNKTWHLSFHKPRGEAGFLAAIEIESDHHGGKGRISNHIRHPLPGKATKRAIARALCKLLLFLVAQDLIAHDDAMETATKVHGL